MNRHDVKNALIAKLREAITDGTKKTRIGLVAPDRQYSDELLMVFSSDEVLNTHALLSTTTYSAGQFTGGHLPEQVVVNGERFHVFKRRFGLGGHRIPVRHTELEIDMGSTVLVQKEIRYVSTSGQVISAKMRSEARRVTETTTVHVPWLFAFTKAVYAVKRVLDAEIKYCVEFVGYNYDMTAEEFEELSDLFSLTLQMEELAKIKNENEGGYNK